MVQIPAQAIRDAQAADAELWPVLLAIAGPESSWNPGAIGDGGTSFGYLQFHQEGGLGDGHAIADLLNGPYNMQAGAQYIRGRLASGASLWDALQPWSTRPAAMDLLARIQSEGVDGVAGDIRVEPASAVAHKSTVAVLFGIGLLIWLVAR